MSKRKKVPFMAQRTVPTQWDMSKRKKKISFAHIKKPEKKEGAEEKKKETERTVFLEKIVESKGIKVKATVEKKAKDIVTRYILHFPEYGIGTKVLLENLKRELIADTSIRLEKMADPKYVVKLQDTIYDRSMKTLEKKLPELPEENKKILTGILLQEMLGLGNIEFLLNDDDIEEIVINSSKEPVWVYHKEIGWLKTNLMLENEDQIHNYASIIARRVGKQITVLTPLLDAHLITGDRVNATLFPISNQGNTLTIRKFRRQPWTVTDFLLNKTTNAETMSLVWMAIQYELNVIISGGTASGKTSLLNTVMPFIQPNHRIVSIEDTRELNLPGFLHWVPLTTRAPNIEGRGGVEMIDLLVNSLRMRPDRIIVGEIRRQKEVEVLFEGMHTGHSAYTTIHANTALDTIRRLTSPPINVPTPLLEAVHLNLVMFRNRATGIRRVYQVAEFIPEKREEEERIKPNVLYRWNPRDDTVLTRDKPTRVLEELMLHTGNTEKEVMEELEEKKNVLDWMAEKQISGISKVGNVMAEYYSNKEEVLKAVSKKKEFEWFG